MSTSDIKSRPVYPPLEWDRRGRHHILLAGAQDGFLAQRLCAAPPPPETLSVIELHEGESVWRPLLPAGTRQLHADGLPAALAQLEELLGAARMGSRLYLVGSEQLIWKASRVAERLGMGDAEVLRHRSGTLARPVYCVHCGHTLQGVQTNLVSCPGCQRALFVRDHFSRRLGAYMGVQVDAEVPGQIPEVERIYP